MAANPKLGAAGEIPLPFFELPVNNSSEAIVANVRANLVRSLPFLAGNAEPRSEPLLIVGGGPSLESYLPLLRSLRGESHVLAVNGSYGYLRERGIEPELFMLMDSRAENLPLVANPCKTTQHYLATQVHPRVVDALDGYPVTLFNLGTRSAHEAHKALGRTEITALQAPIGMASVHAVYLAAALGYRKIFLFGYDFSHADGARYAFNHPLSVDDGALEVHIDGRTFQTTVALARTAEQFFRAIGPLLHPPCELDVRLCSDGLLRAVLEHNLRRPTEESERAKYEAMWAVPAYRRVSPGLEFVGEAERLLGMMPGDSVADFGCGTGRCVTAFSAAGFDSVGVDIAPSAIEEPGVYIEAALWNAEALPRVDWGFSCDVLEHIPTEKVDDTLKAIHQACRKGAYLNIDTIPDAFGVVIGQTLHETVMPGEWWQRKLEALWDSVERIRPDDPRQAVFVCKHKGNP